MTHFNWTNDLKIGHESIDSDHRQLIETNNAFIKLIEEGKGRDALGDILDYLLQYVQVHFKREEDEMLRIGYEAYAEHKQEHDAFSQEINKLKEEFDNGATLSPPLFARILHDCLCNHFAKADTKLVAAIKKSS